MIFFRFRFAIVRGVTACAIPLFQSPFQNIKRIIQIIMSVKVQKFDYPAAIIITEYLVVNDIILS
jgi:hypothetical protein